LDFTSEADEAAPGPPRLQLIRPGNETTWAELAAAYLNSASVAERLAFYNGMEPEAPVPAGTLLKIPPSLAARP